MRNSKHSVLLRTYGLAFAIALSPAFMQSGDLDLTCEKTGDTTLSVFELEVSGQNQITFDPNNRSYVLYQPADVPSVVVRAQSTDPAAQLNYNYRGAGGFVEGGWLGVGGGEVTVDVLMGETTLAVSVKAPGGASDSYVVDVIRAGMHAVPYDRADAGRTTPFPDDYWLISDPSTPTGLRVNVPVPVREADVQVLFLALLNETYTLDGFSPIGGIVVELPEAPDTDSLPMTPAASLDPAATIGLFDLTPGSPSLGSRVPFQLSAVTRTLPGQTVSHSVVLYPSIPLAPLGRYGLVVTRAALADDGLPFGPSPFMTAALHPATAGEDPSIAKARDVLQDGVLDVLVDPQVMSPPIAANEIALALRITVRSTDDIPRTPLVMKDHVLQAPPPTFQITSVTPRSAPLAAEVRGTWQAPNWRNGYFIARDANGDPVVTGTQTLDFVLALPQAAANGPVPIVMYQHGSPGSASEALSQALGGLAEAGFAVIGFTDTLNREAGQSLDAHNALLFETLLAEWRFPNFPMQTYGEQMAFLRVIEQLDTLDVVPAPSGDGFADLDLSAPLTYVGISMGSVHGSGFLPYAPEIRAAALAVGAKREAESYFGGGAFIDVFPDSLATLVPNLRPVEYFVALGVFQMIFDHQDPHNHAAFFYDDPLEVAGTFRKASVLITEGIGDTVIPNNATRSLAWAMGSIPHLEPVQQATPILQLTTGPVTANIDSETTAAFYQFVPVGVPGIPPTPGCELVTEGHYCGQSAPAAYEQRVSFLRSAIDDAAPTIVDPLAAAP